ncbi:MAG: outer membrane beta-barrel protein [Hymenobacteraceae bacterium]|nr:outer membrane beta-barrel protein [Hymenobacteraceae bacterium]MDX5397079.1 outer membrane beta-barrel protein [Hymenobacteraceae bacterium]MDX5513156.1 outer membrane beta-barrel protein [Hymenobacteraceae bacterium]
MSEREKNHIDQLLQSRFEGFGSEPPELVWDNIAHVLEEKRRRKRRWWFWLPVLLGLLLTTGAGAYIYLNSKTGQEKQATNAQPKQENTPVATASEDLITTDAATNEAAEQIITAAPDSGTSAQKGVADAGSAQEKVNHAAVAGNAENTAATKQTRTNPATTIAKKAANRALSAVRPEKTSAAQSISQPASKAVKNTSPAAVAADVNSLRDKANNTTATTAALPAPVKQQSPAEQTTETDRVAASPVVAPQQNQQALPEKSAPEVTKPATVANISSVNKAVTPAVATAKPKAEDLGESVKNIAKTPEENTKNKTAENTGTAEPAVSEKSLTPATAPAKTANTVATASEDEVKGNTAALPEDEATEKAAAKTGTVAEADENGWAALAEMAQDSAAAKAEAKNKGKDEADMDKPGAIVLQAVEVFAAPELGFRELKTGNSLFATLVQDRNAYEKRSIGFSAGALISVELSEKFAVKTGARYLHLKEELSYPVALLTGSPSHSYYDFLTIPLQLTRRIRPFHKLYFDVSAGPEFNLFLGGEGVVADENGNYKVQKWSDSNHPYKTISISVGGGISAYYRVSKLVSVLVRPHAVYFPGSVYQSDDIELKPYSVGVQAGLRFGYY